MKFCKNLQRIIEISDPEWTPYWMNYKMLKKLIKELPSLVPVDERNTGDDSSVDESNTHRTRTQLLHMVHEETTGSNEIPSAAGKKLSPKSRKDIKQTEKLVKSPGEVAFFKFLHAEREKAERFFEKAQQEIAIREERVLEGLEIIKRPVSVMVENKWSYAAKSLFRLYKDLLLLETYAIMTYCSFSKILKKHDKVTGNATRNAFMVKVVNKASFTNYPKLLAMIARCEALYEEASRKLVAEGQENLCEAEREFLSTIFQLKGQYLDTAEKEGADVSERIESQCKRHTFPTIKSNVSSQSAFSNLTTSLRELVEENKAIKQDSMKIGTNSDDCSTDYCRMMNSHPAKRRIINQ